MRNIWNIAINDLRVYLKDPGALVNLFVVPIMIAVVLGFGLGGGTTTTQLRVDVLDNDQTDLSKQFLADLRAANNTLVLCPFDNKEDDFCQLGTDDPTLTEDRSIKRLTDNTALALIEIPAGFEKGVQSGQPQSIVYRSNENAAAPSYILQAVQAVVQRLGGAQVAATIGMNVAESSDSIDFKDDAEKAAFRQAVYDSAASTWKQDPFKVDFQQSAADPNALSSRQRGFGQSIPGIASMFVVIFVLTSMITLPQERKNWTLQRLATMPVSRIQILGGKILMYFLLGMIQFLAMFTVGRILGLSLGNDLVALLAVMVSLTLCGTALAFAMGTFVRTEMQGAALVNLLGLTLAPLGGAWWPLEIVPEFMRTIGHISPIAWAMDGFHSLLYNQGTFGDILLPVGVLLAMAVVFFGIAIARFRYE
ncbi:MAG: ABC transporter permease [Chloroflexota bacterium]